MSGPEAIIRNESTGAGGIIRLSPTMEGSGMGALLNVSFDDMIFSRAMLNFEIKFGHRNAPTS